MILLSEKAAESIVTTELAIESAVEAFSSFSAREANVPLRGEIHRSNPSGIALVMPGLVGNTLGLKFGSSIEAASAPGGRHTTVFLIIWDAATLRPRGVISADVLNNHRTAAGFAAASRVLARSDSTTHVLFGAGKTAFASALYISAVHNYSPADHLQPHRHKSGGPRGPDQATSRVRRFGGDNRHGSGRCRGTRRHYYDGDTVGAARF
jgi:ornithine cyclodeaminase